MKVTGTKKTGVNREEAVGGRDRSYLTKAFRALQNEITTDGEPLLDWEKPATLHDLRTTFSTHLRAKNHPEHIVEMALNHRKSTIQVVYNVGLLVPERKALLNDWADYLASPIENLTSTDNILGITHES